ncbi:MAG: prolyl oligopeptidase family serine peptidase [Cyanobacteria bacterium SZAS-4]|nr:prolyl oligopeptidase family serine peptidase [Cyanobacteria bacterium SZAS-4]
MKAIHNLLAFVFALSVFCPGSLGAPSVIATASIDSKSNVSSLDARARKYASKAHRYVKSIKVGKIRRSYVVNVPKGYGVKPAPVMFVLHGAMGNTFTVAWDTRMTERANEQGFIVVYPRGIGIAKTLMTWNAGDCCGVAKLRNIDDIAFLRALVAKLKEDYKVDADRFYIAGASNGGMMAYRAAMEMSDQIAAIATASGTMMTSQTAPGEPVSVIAFHGTDDHIVPYKGGPGGLPFWKIVGSKVSDNVKFWVARDKCNEKCVHEEIGNYVKDTYSHGANGTEVCVYVVKKGKHNWPGGRAAILRNDPEMGKVDATDLICKFFLAHPKVHNTKASSD